MTRAEHGHLTALESLMAGLGGDVFASGQTAAALHGFDGFSLAPPFDVVVPRGRAPQRVGHIVHTATQLDLIDLSRVAGVAVTSASRTIVDLAATETDERLTAAIDSALRDRLTSEDFLHRRIVALRGRGKYGLPHLVDLLAGAEFARGGESWLERTFLRLIGSAGLPRPQTQVVLSRSRDRLVRVDCWFRDYDVVVELLGYRWHRSTAQMDTDAARLTRLQLDGHLVVQATYVSVVERPDEVVADVTAALSARGRRRRRPSAI